MSLSKSFWLSSKSFWSSSKSSKLSAGTNNHGGGFGAQGRRSCNLNGSMDGCPLCRDDCPPPEIILSWSLLAEKEDSLHRDWDRIGPSKNPLSRRKLHHSTTHAPMICILLFWYNKGKVYQYVIFNHTCTLVSLHIFFPKVLWMVHNEEKALSYSPSCPVYWHQCHGNTQPLCHHCKPLLKKMKTDFLRLIFQQPCALSLKPWLSPGYSASGNSMCAILVETLGWVRNARVRARGSIFRSCAAGLLPG